MFQFYIYMIKIKKKYTFIANYYIILIFVKKTFILMYVNLILDF